MEIGTIIGKLTVVSESERLRLPSGQTNRVFLCKCECGNTKKVRKVHLSNKRINSCGCIKRTKKGLGSSSICKVWRAIRYRCEEGYFQSHLYFNKGISVSSEWINDFDAFYNWAISNGYEKGLQLDRIDNSKGYGPDNCRWVTSKVNCNNRDVTFYVNYNNTKIALQMILKEKGLSDKSTTIRNRILRGWSHEEAIDKPIKKGNYNYKERINILS